MTTPTTPDPRSQHALHPHERALAERLAQLGPHGAPSPALDARILAAARAATTAQRQTSHNPRRWPALIGIAATLALAVGVSWQLQPPGQPTAARSALPPAPATPPRSIAESGAELAAPGVEPGSEPGSAVPEATAAAPVADAPRSRASAMPANGAAANASRPIPPVATPSGERAPMTFPAAPTVRLPPREQAGDTAATMQTPRPATDRRLQGASAEADAARPQAGSPAASARMAAGPAAIAGLPVTQDSQLEPAPWLDRIGLRRDADDMAGARESLRLFRRTHPHVVVPNDLRALLADAAVEP